VRHALAAAGLLSEIVCDIIHEVLPLFTTGWEITVMDSSVLPIFVFAACAIALATVVLLAGVWIGPRRTGAVKRMPYESGMDPIHGTRRRFDVRFHLVAIAFLIFDVELLFLYPWAVASRHPRQGIDWAVSQGWISNRALVFWGVALFMALVITGLVYEWRRGVLRWR
jgi:NADH-quinone oxidoreductase subunit A